MRNAPLRVEPRHHARWRPVDHRTKFPSLSLMRSCLMCFSCLSCFHLFCLLLSPLDGRGSRALRSSFLLRYQALTWGHGFYCRISKRYNHASSGHTSGCFIAQESSKIAGLLRWLSGFSFTILLPCMASHFCSGALMLDPRLFFSY